LPFLVTAAMIGVGTGALSPVNGAALVCAGLGSVLLFPSAALGLLRRPDAVVPTQRVRRARSATRLP